MPPYWQRAQSRRLSPSLSPLTKPILPYTTHILCRLSVLLFGTQLWHLYMYVCMCSLELGERPILMTCRLEASEQFKKIYIYSLIFYLWHTVYAGIWEFFTYAQNTLPVSIWHRVCVVTGLCTHVRMYVHVCILWYPYTCPQYVIHGGWGLSCIYNEKHFL